MQIYFCGAWRSLVARPAGGREVVGSNPAAPTINKIYKKEIFLKRIIILSTILFIFFGCSDTKPIHESYLYQDKIEFPFEEIDNGKFITIFRNLHNESISLSVVMLTQNEVLKDSQSLDYCEGVNALRNGKNVLEWTIINHNYSFIPESSVENQNDHPGMISYSFPKGTYMIMMMNQSECNRDNYVIFDVNTNEGIELVN